MCLAVPMRIITIESNDAGEAEIDNLSYPVNLSLIEEPRIGDYVIVHAGFAIERLEEDDALERIKLLRELAEAAPANQLRGSQSQGDK